MHLPHVIRSLASSGALVGAVACLFQVPPLWERGSSGLNALPFTWKDQFKSFTVVVDAGHGGEDGGTRGGGIQEKDGTLDIALRLEKQLLGHGVHVRMTRSDDHYLTLDERCVVANEARADAFVSIHLNASPGTEAAGIETYFSSRQKLAHGAELRQRIGVAADLPIQDQRSPWLASCIQRGVARVPQTKDRGCRDSGFYVVRNTECPAVLVECGYLTSAEEAAHLKSNDHRDCIARIIADGVCHFLLASKVNPARGIIVGEGSRPATGADSRDAPD